MSLCVSLCVHVCVVVVVVYVCYDFSMKLHNSKHQCTANTESKINFSNFLVKKFTCNIFNIKVQQTIEQLITCSRRWFNLSKI